MLDAEDIAVGAVSELIAYCPRLDAQIDKNDKTPVTDGHIDVYKGYAHTNADLIGRVVVQVKGRAHQNKKVFKKDSTTFAVEREVLAFLRDDGGGMYFYVAVHPESRHRKVFYAILNPFKLGRLIGEMKPGQSTKNVPLKALPDEPAHIERLVEFALSTKNQDLRLGFDAALLGENARFTLYSADGLDLSRPAKLDITKTDFAVVAHTEGGLKIPVDLDMEIIPSNYVPHQREMVVRCGRTRYSNATVKTLDDDAVEIVLSKALRLTLLASDTVVGLNVEVTSEGNLQDQIDALDFFISASDGQTITIDGASHPPSSPPSSVPAELMNQRKRLGEVADLLDALHVDRCHLSPSNVDDSQWRILTAMYHALVRGQELSASAGSAGRFDLGLGDFTATLMALPGADANHWRFIDVFDPANRTQFRLLTPGEDGQLKEIQGTAYEGLTAEELATTLNLRLDSLVGAYEGVSDKPAAYVLANLKVLHLIGAADHPETPQRERLLDAAADLNEWLIHHQGEESIHLINRWQILARGDSLPESVKDQIRSLRRTAVRANTDDSDVLEACCAILLGDEADIRHVVRALSPEVRGRLGTWPIWRLAGLLAGPTTDDRRPRVTQESDTSSD